MDNKLLIIIVAAVIAIAAIAVAVFATGNGDNGGNGVPSVDDSVTGTVNVNDYISYGDQFTMKVSSVNGDKLTVLKNTESVEMTKSEFIKSMSASSLLDEMKKEASSVDNMKIEKISSLKFDEEKTINGHTFKIYHSDFEGGAKSSESGMDLEFDAKGTLKFYIDEKGITQMIRTTITDVEFDLGGLTPEQQALVNLFIDALKAELVGHSTDEPLATNLSFVTVIPVTD